jgi:DEAD/DEAH box helicase domain-containing protein
VSAQPDLSSRSPADSVAIELDDALPRTPEILIDDTPRRPVEILTRLLSDRRRAERVRHIERLPARVAIPVAWPAWVPDDVVAAFAGRGITAPWAHQVDAADRAHAGRSVVIATGTASGKSLAYQLPILAAIATEPLTAPGSPSAPASSPAAPASSASAAAPVAGRRPGVLSPPTALYLAPTKALAADQAASLSALGLSQLRQATFDGDTSYEERAWIRANANLVLANPDVLHHSMLAGHRQWAAFLRGLRYVVIDECHTYRGVFGSHVAHIVRRLRRTAARYGATPVFVLASATMSEPAETARRLTGLDVEAVTADASPRAASDFVLWEPPPAERLAPDGPAGTDGHGASGSDLAAGARRSAIAETADLLADLAADGVRTVAFVRSRRGVEAVALAAKRALDEVDPALGGRIAAYRGGYLPDERRALERALRHGRLLGLAATTALELGIDVCGLDAVLLTGYPGTRASMWQQAGRAGRAGQESLAVMIARDDPLDTYLVQHPQALFGQPVEAVVLDPDNPYVVAPHLCAAAAEWPLDEAELGLFGPAARAAADELTAAGLLRRRESGWYWTRRERASDLADIRGTGGRPISIVESATGQLLGTANPATAHASVHTGAVYLHQGATYVVARFDPDDYVALVDRADVDYYTTARDVTDFRITEPLLSTRWGEAAVSFGVVHVTTQVVSFLRRRVLTGEVLDETPLDLPARELETKGVWWTIPDDALAGAGLSPAVLPGAAHAAEHASIGLLPLVATCDRWDIGGVSTARHVDTEQLTVVVYDGHVGGAGFAERGYAAAPTWLRATRDAIAGCGCDTGCPSCVQSPKCGNGNDPLDKAAAVTLLDLLLGAAPIGS